MYKIKTKTHSQSLRFVPVLALVIVAGFVVVALAGCASAQQQQRQQDIKTCAKLGLTYGSQDNLLCVQRQQRQRGG
jgi:hypothetical protein